MPCPYAHLSICPDSSKSPFYAFIPYYTYGNMPYAHTGKAICHMPICPHAQIRLNPPLMPLYYTEHMGICDMPVWERPYAICPYGHMPIYMAMWSGLYDRARITSCVATATSIRTTHKSS